MGSKVNNYSNGDMNLESVMLTLDKAFYGKIDGIFLTNHDNTTLPAIPSGSIAEVGGALFKFDAEESISGSPSDGLVYVKLIPSGDTVTAQFTNTAPVWSDAKCGYYGTLTNGNHKYIGGCYKSGTSYTSKFFYRGFEIMPKKFDSKLTIFTAQAMPIQIDTGTWTHEYTYTITHNVQIEALISILPLIRMNWGWAGTMAAIPYDNVQISSTTWNGNVLTVKIKLHNPGGVTGNFDISLNTSVVGY